MPGPVTKRYTVSTSCTVPFRGTLSPIVAVIVPAAANPNNGSRTNEIHTKALRIGQESCQEVILGVSPDL
jgi:hypothetical protein